MQLPLRGAAGTGEILSPESCDDANERARGMDFLAPVLLEKGEEEEGTLRTPIAAMEAIVFSESSQLSHFAHFLQESN